MTDKSFISVLSMVIDHWAYFFLEPENLLYPVMRCFGRIAFPLFAFLIAEGAAYTRNRWRYVGTLLFFGLISELPWFMLNGNDWSHNGMFILALGVMTIALFVRLGEHGSICFASMLVFAGIAWVLKSDYDWRGVLMIVLFTCSGQRPFSRGRSVSPSTIQGKRYFRFYLPSL